MSCGKTFEDEDGEEYYCGEDFPDDDRIPWEVLCPECSQKTGDSK